MVADWARHLSIGFWAVSAVTWAIALWYAVKADRAHRELRRLDDARLARWRELHAALVKRKNARK